MSITQLVGALGAHRYLLVFVLLAAYARRLTAPDSKFPITVPDAWRPIVTTAFGIAYGVLATIQAGATWRGAVVGGVVAAATAGFADMLLVAIFSDPARAPAWARALAFLVDDLKGSGSAPTGGAAVPPDANSGSNGPALHRTGSVAAVVAAAALVTGCANVPPPNVPSDLANDYSCVEGDLSRGITSFAQIEADCSPGQIGTVVDMVDWILASRRAPKFAALAPVLRTELNARRPAPSQ